MKYVGYHRVSTNKQHLDRGVDEIEKFCLNNSIELFQKKVYTDKQTGKNFDRPAYLIVKELLEPDKGDVLIISSLDRLGRDAAGIKRELSYFYERNIRIMILNIPTTLTDIGGADTTINTLMMQLINNIMIEMWTFLSQQELETKYERQKGGIRSMKKRGDYNSYGKSNLLSLTDFAREYEKNLNGSQTVIITCKNLGISKSTFYSYKERYHLKKTPNYLYQQALKRHIDSHFINVNILSEESPNGIICTSDTKLKRYITSIKYSVINEYIEYLKQNGFNCNNIAALSSLLRIADFKYSISLNDAENKIAYMTLEIKERCIDDLLYL